MNRISTIGAAAVFSLATGAIAGECPADAMTFKQTADGTELTMNMAHIEGATIKTDKTISETEFAQGGQTTIFDLIPSTPDELFVNEYFDAANGVACSVMNIGGGTDQAYLYLECGATQISIDPQSVLVVIQEGEYAGRSHTIPSCSQKFDLAPW